MTYQTLISPQEIHDHLGNPEWVIVDCRFVLDQPEKGWQNYLAGHIPGAVYAHLNRDLSGPIIPGKTGRHPLPSVEKASEVFSRLGISAGVQVVAYDDQGGAMGAARLWWMLRWLGHFHVAVLDGGWQAWKNAGGPVSIGEEHNPTRQFVPKVRMEIVADADLVSAVRLNPDWRVLDSRSAERFRGENETIDPVAGHIPGAISVPYSGNLRPDSFFLPQETLRKRFDRFIQGVSAENVIFYCGSGVSAAQNVLAMLHAGLGEARLYAGSWSEWITDPQRPVEKG